MKASAAYAQFYRNIKLFITASYTMDAECVYSMDFL